MHTNAQPFTPVDAICEIADFLADPVDRAVFPQHILRWRNDRAAAQIGLADLTEGQWIAHFGRFEPLEGSLPQPLALRYHGHQFRVYNPDIGDGRGFLFAQAIDDAGRLMDLGTKGSGQTPFSRFGDGRLTLKGGVREILATEMLEALGVATSRTFSLIETGEQLHRGDEPSPTRSAVMVRLSHGHIRIGSFQRLATLGETENLRRLTDYCLRHYFNDAGSPEHFLLRVAERTANLAASYMAAGFVHGVLNSDNINISGESFDYGPWRFAPTFDGDFTAAYFDSAGLYRFGRQAEAIHWNLAQLAVALSSITGTDVLEQSIAAFAPAYRAALIDRFIWRLGVEPRNTYSDRRVLQAIESTLASSGVAIDDFFFVWAGGRARQGDCANPLFDELRAALDGYQPRVDLSHAYWSNEKPCQMLIEDVEAIWSSIAENDDWTPLNAKITLIRDMGQALANRRPPD